MRTLTKFFLLVLVVVVGGCVLLPDSRTVTTRPVLDYFEVDGRIAVSNRSDGGNARIRWVHSADGDTWTLLNPVGQFVAKVTATEEGAELLDAEGGRRRAADVGELLEDLIGMDVPVARLMYWVQGVLPESAEVRAYDETGRFALVDDFGWRITYLGYLSERRDALPSLIEVSRGDARLKFAIHQWKTVP